MGDGEYWIDPEGNGKSLKVYCDMTTAGGKLPSAALLFSKSLFNSSAGVKKWSKIRNKMYS